MTEPNTPRRFLYGTSSCKNATLVWTNLVSLHVYVHETFVPHVTPPPPRPPSLAHLRDLLLTYASALSASALSALPVRPSALSRLLVHVHRLVPAAKHD